MTVRCPSCGTTYQAPDQGGADGRLRCRVCGTVFTAAEGAEPVPPGAVPLDEVVRRVAPVTGGLPVAPPAARRPTGPPPGRGGNEPRGPVRDAKRRSIPWKPLLAALVLLALVAGGLLAWRSMRRDREVERLLAANVLTVFGGPEIIRQPGGLAAIPDGRIAVVDRSDHAVRTFSSSGEPEARMGGFGVGDNELWDPEGLSYAAGNLATFDTGNGSIKVFDLSGGLVTRHVVYDRFYLPRDLSLGEDGTIVVADTGNHRLVALGADGATVRTIGSRGEGKGELDNPYSVIRLPGGRLATADVGNNRITIFSSDGSVERGWRYEGSGGQYTITPSLGWVRGAEVIALADQHLGRVQFFTPEGKLAGIIGVQPDGRKVFGEGGPLFVDCAREGELAVLTDRGQVYLLGY